MKTYHFGLPGQLIWSVHIVFGLFLAYVGSELMANRPLDRRIPQVLLMVGVIMALYHAHIWYSQSTNNGSTTELFKFR